MTTHSLKILPQYFSAVLSGDKTFEIRNNDRNFQVGDFVLLKEFDINENHYTGKSVKVQIKYLTDYKQNYGYVVFSFKIV
ncbi:MAG: DUF3850 domain-containing protein [Furfurilactobacillus sp.]|jgi:hypothetical protein|uniref:DUF3850 domain-containing protein n=1 Tax=Furfurilactobacillus TaxID=2767882 RepID=UPI001F285547|nr:MULTISPECIES: DUF3850 domain-containing protein [Furfurilactobacillus]MCF6418630.1 DUF3850 domain-containing protein [Furfurilactobacillus milii]MCH4012092.1 DUF3850 domain-containing protein [Furfurilactobacillus sp.]MCH4037984.1 DUF3850 domain-containing protein [Furfurilactobacillus sp.]MCH4115379.1 DUF3850 domain-containing protein [Furfurilactobacillus sp.]MCI1340600.1 DUF3850 domain-containing protein [Furfurilactobacillus sp.]